MKNYETFSITVKPSGYHALIKYNLPGFRLSAIS